MEIPKSDSDSSDREYSKKHYSEHKFGNAIPNFIIINVNIEFDSKFGTSIPNPITVKVITQFNRSIPILLCTDRKYEVSTGSVKTNNSKQASDENDTSEYMDNPFLGVTGFTLQCF